MIQSIFPKCVLSKTPPSGPAFPLTTCGSCAALAGFAMWWRGTGGWSIWTASRPILRTVTPPGSKQKDRSPVTPGSGLGRAFQLLGSVAPPLLYHTLEDFQ